MPYFPVSRTIRVFCATVAACACVLAQKQSTPSGDLIQRHAGMAHIPGGEFWMGMEDPRPHEHGGHEAMDDARPVHRVRVRGFWMDKTDVTNREFARFVRSTGYVTVAERKPEAKDFPGADTADLVPGAIVFTNPRHPVSLSDPYAWWRYVPGANWRHPLGSNSSIIGRDNDPVVQIAYEDAEAYAKWIGKRLPTEAEWEYAARGGLDRKLYAWGDSMNPNGRWMANTYQGTFPIQDEKRDGYSGIAPVASFAPNGYGLYDMSGNVWQWVSDWYRPDYYAQLRDGVADNPRGPSDSYDPVEPGVRKRVQRGGSFLCTDEYCTRFMVGARGRGEPSSATNHVGFRCVMDE